MSVDDVDGDVDQVQPIPRPPRRDQLGLIRRLLRTPQTVLDEFDASYGPICELGGGPLRLAVVGSPALVHELLMQPNDRFRAEHTIEPVPVRRRQDHDDRQRRR